MADIAFVKPVAYDNNSVSIATATTDYNWKVTGGGFTNAPKSKFVSIRTDKTITVKLNATTNDGISITATDSPFEINNLMFITNLFITNASGNTAVVQVFNV